MLRVINRPIKEGDQQRISKFHFFKVLECVFKIAQYSTLLIVFNVSTTIVNETPVYVRFYLSLGLEEEVVTSSI